MHTPRFLILISLMIVSSKASAWWMWTPGDHVDNTDTMFSHAYHPKQPMPFSHKLHAGDYKMDCQYCHTAARRSPSAGIPPMSKCMGCHKFVNTDTDPIKFLTEKYKKNEPIEWTKVHVLPDYVRFSHQPHVLAKDENGKLRFSCQTCHGDVQNMTTAKQHAPLQMGWCLDCHNQEVSPAEDGKPAVKMAPISCATCHY